MGTTKLSDFQSSMITLIPDTFSRIAAQITIPKGISKWLCFSDYCLHDPSKPNDVVAISLMPFVDESKHLEIEAKINSLQPKDIKKSKIVNDEFLKLIKDGDFYHVVVSLVGRESWLGDTKDERFSNMKDCLTVFQNQYKVWADNEVDETIKKGYIEVANQFEHIGKTLSHSDVPLLWDIMIVSSIIAYVYRGLSLSVNSLDVVGWFSDRDNIMAFKNGIAATCSQATLHCALSDRHIKYAYSGSDTGTKPFYDTFNRIPDFLCGTIADYNFESEEFSKPKFATVLENVFVDNPKVICGIISKADDSYSIKQISFHKR